MSMSFDSAFGSSDPFGDLLNRFFSTRRSVVADNRIASLLLGGVAGPGDTIVADVQNDSLHVAIRAGAEDTTAQAPTADAPS